VEFEAKYPGDWMIHCHLPHHMMNSMMDLLRDRQISTADLTEEGAMEQMQSQARARSSRMYILHLWRKMRKRRRAFRKTHSWKMGMDELVEKPETHGLPEKLERGNDGN